MFDKVTQLVHKERLLLLVRTKLQWGYYYNIKQKRKWWWVTCALMDNIGHGYGSFIFIYLLLLIIYSVLVKFKQSFSEIAALINYSR